MSTYNSISPVSLKEEFLKQTKSDKIVNAAFNNLWMLYRNFFEDSSFFNYTVQGYLNKESEEKGIRLFK